MEVPGMQSAVQFCSTPIAARHLQWLKIHVWVYVFVISLTFTLSGSDLHSVLDLERQLTYNACSVPLTTGFPSSRISKNCEMFDKLLSEKSISSG